MPFSRLVRSVVATALAAAGLQVAALGVAPSASAAPPADCVNALYLTANSGGGRVLRLDLATQTLGTTSVYTPVTASGNNPNQLGIGPDGNRAINTDRTTNQIVNRNLLTDTTQTAGSAAIAGLGIAGAINPADGLYYFGGYSGGNLVLHSYDPVANTASANPVATISVPNAPASGTNGDISFDPSGNLYFVSSSTSDFALYSKAGPSPTSGAATRLAGDSGLGGAAVNGIAFGSDGFLYIGQALQVRQVNPVTGAQTGTTVTLPAGTSSTDLASCAAAPTSLTVKASVSDRHAATDQFVVTAVRPAADGTSSFPVGTTAGDDDGVQDDPAEVAGPAIVFPGNEYTFTQTASGTTDLARYTTTWSCADATGTVVADGTGSSGTFTAPGGGAGVTCVFTNTPINPAITLDKSVSPTRFNAAGETLTYTFAISNTGNAALSNLTLDDGMSGLGTPTCTPVDLGASLAAGQSTTCTATYTTTPADVSAAANKSNTATASGTPPNGLPTATSPSSTATATFVGQPVATDDSRNTRFDTPVTLPGSTNDTPGDPAGNVVHASTVFTSAAATNGGKTLVTAQGTWQVNPGGTVTFTPAPGYVGTTPAVEYRITDGDGGTDTADLVVTVRSGPSAAPDEDTTPQGVQVVLDPAALTNDTPSLAADGTAGSFDPSSLVFTVGGTPGGVVSDGGKTLTIAGQGVFTVGTGGAVTFDPEPTFVGTTTAAAYTVTDDAGNETGSTIRIVVTDVAPVADDDFGSTPFDQPITLEGMTDDAPGDPGVALVPASTVFTSAAATNGGKTLVTAQGTWQVNPSGSVTFTPVPGYVGTTPLVEYRIADRNGTTDVADLRVTVRPGPQAQPDSDTTPQGLAVTVDPLTNDTPGLLANGDDGSWVESSVRFPSNGNPGTVSGNGRTLTVPGEGEYTVDPVTGEITFDPEPQFTATATPVTYVVTDSNGNDASSTFTITVTPVVPVAEDDSDTTPFDTPVTLPAVTDDAPGHPSIPLVPGGTVLTSAQATNNGKTLVTTEGTWQVNPNGTVTFTPADGYTGTTAPVEYRIVDQNGTSDEALLTVRVAAGPLADPDTDTTLQNTPITVDVVSDDTPGAGETFDRTSVVFEAGRNPGTVSNNGTTLTVPDEAVYTIDPVTGDVTFTPEADFSGPATSVTYTVTDSAGNDAFATLTITVTAVVPVANDDSASTPFDTSVTLPAVTDDDAGDPSAPLVPGDTVLTSAQATNNGKTLVTAEGTWQVNADGSVTFTPAAGYVGTTPAVEYRITDANGTTDEAQLVVTVRPGPQAAQDVDTTPQGVAVTVDPLTNDTPGLLANGDDGSWVESSVRFPSNGNPGTVSGNGRTLTVPGEGEYTVDPVTGEVTFDPEPQFAGVATPVTYVVTDSNGNDASSTITITVTPVVPLANDDAAGTPFNTAVTLPAVTDDAPGAGSAPLVPGATVFTSAQSTNNGKTLVTAEGTWQVNADGTVTFTPRSGYHGTTAPVEYRIADTNGTTDTAFLTVTVRPAPQATPDTGTTPQDTDITVSVLGNDTPGPRGDGSAGSFDPATLVFTSPAATNGGRTLVVPGEGTYSIDPATGSVTFDPLPGFTGQATPVAYAVTDRNGSTTGSTLTITVTPVAPQATDDEGDASPDRTSTAPGDPVTVSVIDNDSAAPGEELDPASVCLLPGTASGKVANGRSQRAARCVKGHTEPGVGTWTVNEDGTITFTPADGYTGTASIGYTVEDSGGNVHRSTLTVDVKGDPDVADDEGTSGPDQVLPDTGGPQLALLVTAFGLVLLGGILLLARRRVTR